MSNFHPDTGGRRWSLVQVRLFSPAAGSEGRCRQISLAHVGSTHSAPATLGLPRSRCLCFPRLHCSGSQLLYGERPCVACGSSFRVLHKSADSVGPAFCAFPTVATQAARSLTGSLSPVRWAFSPPRSQPQFLLAGPVLLVTVLGSWSLATTLPADVTHPKSQEVFG